ncbi:MAG: glycosyltransferase family 1 protein, partial [Sphingomonas bacterium]
GTPVAAYPVTGPLDVLTPEGGAMREDLAEAVAAALALDPRACAETGARHGWRASAEQFLAALAPLPVPLAA